MTTFNNLFSIFLIAICSFIYLFAIKVFWQMFIFIYFPSSHVLSKFCTSAKVKIFDEIVPP